MPKERTVIITYFKKVDGTWWANYTRYGDEPRDFGGKTLGWMIDYVHETLAPKFKDIREFVCLTKTKGYTQEPRIFLKDYLTRCKQNAEEKSKDQGTKEKGDNFFVEPPCIEP